MASVAAPAPVSSTAGGSKKPKAKATSSSEHPLKLKPSPSYIDHRIQLFDKLKAEYDEWVKQQPRQEICIKLPDGSVRSGTSWETRPIDIAKSISPSLGERIVISKVDEVLWDLERPLEKSVSLELLDFTHKDGKSVFWHSSAHVLGEAAELYYGCNLCMGLPTEDGFYYEIAIENRVVHPTDFPALEKLSDGAIKQKQKFERLVVSKENLLKMFEYNKYKKFLINSTVPDGESTTVYRCGPMIDLCPGPHIPHTGHIEAMMVAKNSASYFLGEPGNDSLQRISGISFPSKKELDEHKVMLAEAAKRDHRKIGKEQELFFFNDLSPGSCFFLPHGTRMYNCLVELMRSELAKRGYQEVISPNMFNVKLWETSGHWKNYKNDMFTLEVEKESWALKPMNCPGHCLIFDSRDRSYKELPIRMAEFGVLHRNEASGALTGLTRVRRFVQDDAHIFCMPSQIEDEIAGIFDLMQSVYGLFDFTFELELSTRPDNYLGEIETWDLAEKQLSNALDKFRPGKWKEKPGDGAFYGPKIDIGIRDALGRIFQCATCQLDFQLPERFQLRYRGPDDGDAEKPMPRPVIIHRAILGSLERFMAILTEHLYGKWPFWLSPRQVLVVPIAAPFQEYASEVANKLSSLGIFADVDDSDNSLGKKIRNGEVSQYNFIFVVGEQEQKARSVNIRNRDDVGQKSRSEEIIPLDTVCEQILDLKKTRRLQNKLL
ncbi:tars protein [Schizopora paradoxa]|uniref:Probable threonine--tRNA ligase, cytoplasmic n=1 Tax=Schizopora paradoxa TaxID=27342 RepID=A0A0H2RRK6_9AGAM|nr:tars protein [Schizopora paradoxa]